MIPLIGPLISLITVGVEKYAENKKLKAEHKNAIQMANTRRVQKLDDNDANWDTVMAEGSKDSWKDEFWTIILAVPAVLAFVPGMVPYVREGFAVLDTMPEWYRYALLLAIGAAFGFRQLIKYAKK